MEEAGGRRRNRETQGNADGKSGAARSRSASERENPGNDSMVELYERGRGSWRGGLENREVEKRSLITLKFNVSS